MTRSSARSDRAVPKLVLVSLACVHCATSERGVAPARELHATGAVSSPNGGASFDEARVIGPRITMTRREDGSWIGTLDGHPIDVTVYPSRVVGVDLTLTIERSPSGYIIHGQYQGRIFRIERDEQRLLVGMPEASLELRRSGREEFSDSRVTVRLTGEASRLNPPWPQLPFAVLGTF